MPITSHMRQGGLPSQSASRQSNVFSTFIPISEFYGWLPDSFRFSFF
jgi:hypothetical protein